MASLFYSVLKTNKHNFLKEISVVKCKTLLKKLKATPYSEEVAFLYPTKQCEKLFAFLFPEEYKNFLELIEWAKISWEPVDTSHFETLETY